MILQGAVIRKHGVVDNLNYSTHHIEKISKETDLRLVAGEQALGSLTGAMDSTSKRW